MRSALRIPLGALVTGLAAYLAISLTWPEIPVSEFFNVIGLAALVGGAGAAVVGRWLSCRGADRGGTDA
jgi:hypothetical protein